LVVKVPNDVLTVLLLINERCIDVRQEDADDLRDLLAPPGNRLEKLRGDREGQYSIRINDQWRICFRWQDDHAHDVEIVDYH
jgi:toxin HigB-1